MELYYQVIENAITMLGIEPSTCRGEVPGQWTLKNKEQEVWIDLWEIETEKRPYFQVLAPMMQLSSEISPAIYRELLEINYNLYGVAFSVKDSQIYVKILREAEDLTAKEAHAMILRIGTYAVDIGEELYDKYFSGNSGPGAISDL